MINLLNFSLLLLAQSAIFRYVFSIFIKTRLTFKKFVMRLFLNCSAYNIYCAHCSLKCLVKVNFYDKTFHMLKCDKRAFLVYFFSFSKIKKSHKHCINKYINKKRHQKYDQVLDQLVILSHRTSNTWNKLYCIALF